MARNTLKSLIISALLLVSGNSLAIPATVVRVIDGDTVVIQAPWVPDPLKKEISVRVIGVDTPEKGFRAGCEQESERGQEATKFTEQVVELAKKIEVTFIDWDKYGGRILGNIIIDGVSLTDLLIQRHYARPYHGEKKETWCPINP